jgi:hypothetical protein
MAELRTHARFPEVALDAPHYESFYLKASDPNEAIGVWIRYTVFKRPGERPLGSLWFTLFERGAEPQAMKVTLEPDALGSRNGEYIHIGESVFEPGRVGGTAAPEGHPEASWMLEFDGDEPPLHHLPSDWMYRASIPRTKLLSPHPDVRYHGYVKLGERRVQVDGWPGMVGHNWGTQHAERWIWLHGASFEGQNAWFDAALGRIKLGPLTAPWIGNGVLSLDGVRHRLGGAEKVRSTEVEEHPDNVSFVLPGKDLRVRGTVGADRGDFVGWVYSDPDGHGHNTVNCSISRVELVVERKDGADLTLSSPSGGAYELGMRETDHGIPIQPFTDP